MLQSGSLLRSGGLVQGKQEDDHLGKQSTLHCMLAILGVFGPF